MAGGPPVSGGYSARIAAVYVFNLMVGVGALALPKAFNEAGLVMGFLFVMVVAMIGFITSTYVVEAMACTNALLYVRRGSAEELAALKAELRKTTPPRPQARAVKKGSRVPVVKRRATSVAKEGEGPPAAYASNSESSDEDRAFNSSSSKSTPPTGASAAGEVSDHELEDVYDSGQGAAHHLFEVRDQAEMGYMAEFFLGDKGKVIFYTVLCLYLYGDLAIYAASVPVSLQQVIPHVPYRLLVIIFAVVAVPFCFMDIQGTKYMQMATLGVRNAAFWIMIAVSMAYIASGYGFMPVDHEGHDHIETWSWSGLPVLFGVALYSFMCHHSLPSLLTPVKHKGPTTLLKVLTADYALVFCSYVIMCITANFAFGSEDAEECASPPMYSIPCRLQSLYTDNFASFKIGAVRLFLVMFPVFTLTSNFPLICITLRNNLMGLLSRMPLFAATDSSVDSAHKSRHEKRLKYFCAFIAAVPPIIIALITSDITFLVELTGAYPGLGIQYVFPMLLVYVSRRRVEEELQLTAYSNRSPFGGKLGLGIVLFWSLVTFSFTTYNLVTEFAGEFISEIDNAFDAAAAGNATSA